MIGYQANSPNNHCRAAYLITSFSFLTLPGLSIRIRYLGLSMDPVWYLRNTALHLFHRLRQASTIMSMSTSDCWNWRLTCYSGVAIFFFSDLVSSQAWTLLDFELSAAEFDVYSQNMDLWRWKATLLPNGWDHPVKHHLDELEKIMFSKCICLVELL